FEEGSVPARVVRIEFMQEVARCGREYLLPRLLRVPLLPEPPCAVLLGEPLVGEPPVVDGPGVLDEDVADHLADDHPRVERPHVTGCGTGTDGAAQRGLVERVQSVPLRGLAERVMALLTEDALVAGIRDGRPLMCPVLFNGFLAEARHVQVSPHKGR